jgi:CheY-like chemotaxis protein
LDPSLQVAAGGSLLQALRDVPAARRLPLVVIAESSPPEELRSRISFATALWLQRPLDEARLVQCVREALALSPAARPRILHLEDDADIRAIVATIARDCATCESAASLEEARALLRESRYDLVLLDLDLGGSSGWDLLQDLDQLPTRPPVIVFSACNVDPSESRGVEATLVKAQTSEAELLRAIRTTLSTETA